MAGGRRVALLFVVGVLLTGPVAAGWAGHAQASTATTTTASNPPTLVFRSNATASLTTLAADGSTTGLGVDSTVAGPMKDIDGDGALETVYVDGNGDIHLVDASGETEQVSATSAPTAGTAVATGDFDGDGTLAVFYPNTADNNTIYKVEYGGSPTQVVDARAAGVTGLTDYDGDGDRDLVFVGNGTTIKYYDGSTVTSTGYGDVGTDPGLGVGAPADFDDDGQARVPVVNTNNTLVLVGAGGGTTKPAPNYEQAANGSVAAVDWVGDSREELVHVDTNGTLAYLALDGSSGQVRDENGNVIAATPSVGVAPAAPPPGPVISDYSVSSPENRRVRVAFTASTQLSDIQVTIEGPTFTTLTEADFTENAAGDGYRYVATYTPETDGQFTATLRKAVDANGVDGAAGESETVTVDVAPSISGYTVSNPDGRTVRVRFAASEELAEIGVIVDGPTGTTLTEEDFVRTGANPVTYAASYTPDADGTYTVRLRTARDSAGHEGATGQSGNVSVNGPPIIATYDVSNPGGREITVSFTSTEQLGNLSVAVTGPNGTTLGPEAFARTDLGDHYRYVATYTPPVDGEYTAALQRAADQTGRDGASGQSGTVRVDGAPRIEAFDISNPGGQNVTVQLEASERLVGLGVSISGPENRTVSKAAFSRRESGDGYVYEANVTVARDGRYTARLTTATDSAGHDAASGQTATVSVRNPAPTVRGATIIDASDGDAIVPADARVRLEATVEGEGVERVTANLSALGAGTVRLSPEAGNTYAATTVVEADDAVSGGVSSFTITAHNKYGNSGSDVTGQLVIDTATPTADAGANRTVPANTSITFDASGTRDNLGIASHRWSFGNNTTAAGTTVTHTFTAPGTYTVELTAVDVAGNRDSDTLRVVVENSTGGESATTTKTRTPTSANESGVLRRETAAVSSDAPHVARFESATVRLAAFESPQASEVRVKRHASLPESVSAYPGAVIRPLTIEVEGNDDANATLVVSVDRDALGGLDPDRVVFSRYHGEEWQHLETSVVTSTDETVTFSVQTPGFSVFALGAPGVESMPAQQSTVTPAESDESRPSPLAIGLGGVALFVCLGVLLAHRRYRLF